MIENGTIGAVERIGIWRVGHDGTREVAHALEELRTTETEQRLEELLVASPEVLMPGLSLIGRQLATAGGPLDLLGIDREGRLVLFELKRGTLTRDAVAQVLDYASFIERLDSEEFASLIEKSSGRLGIDRIDDFADWYQGEFPDVAEPPPAAMSLVLVGLGSDERATRMVNYLAAAGLDIQVVTFQAFRAGDEILLARHVETVEVTKRSDIGENTKEGNLRILRQRAAEHGVADLLFEVADFVAERMPGYQWPGKTAFTFSLQELTDEGRPTLRSYGAAWLDEKVDGQVIFSLPDRAILAASSAVDSMVQAHACAERTTNSWMPFRVLITRESWPEVKGPIADLLTAVVDGWRRKSAEASQAMKGRSLQAESGIHGST